MGSHLLKNKLTIAVTISLTLCTARWLSPEVLAPINEVVCCDDLEEAGMFCGSPRDETGGSDKGSNNLALVLSNAIRDSNNCSESGHIRSKSRKTDVCSFSFCCEISELPPCRSQGVACRTDCVDAWFTASSPEDESGLGRLCWIIWLDGDVGKTPVSLRRCNFWCLARESCRAKGLLHWAHTNGRKPVSIHHHHQHHCVWSITRCSELLRLRSCLWLTVNTSVPMWEDTAKADLPQDVPLWRRTCYNTYNPFRLNCDTMQCYVRLKQRAHSMVVSWRSSQIVESRVIPRYGGGWWGPELRTG